MPKGTVVTLPGDARPMPTAPAWSRAGWSRMGRQGLALLAEMTRPAGLAYNVVAFLLGRVSILGELAPFGLAFFAAVAQVERPRAPAVAVWALAGGLSAGRYLEAGVYFLVILVYWRLAGRLTRQEKKIQAGPLFLFSAVILGGGLLVLWQQTPLYHLLLVAFDAGLCVVLTYIFQAALMATAAADRRPLSSEMVMCLLVLVAAAVAGFGELAVAGYSLRNMAGGLAIMVLALSGGPGLGTAAGVVVGLVTGLSGGDAPLLISLYAVAGLLAAAFRSQGKLAVIAGFLLGSAIGVLAFGQAQLLPAMAEAAMAAAVFAVLPMPWLRVWSRGLREQAQRGGERPERAAADKLVRVAGIFDGLAATLSQGAADEAASGRAADEARLLAAVGERVCGPCRRRSACWDKAHEQTAQGMLACLAAAEDGQLAAGKLPAPLRTSCERAGLLADTVNAVAAQNRLATSWQNRLTDTRRLLAEQLRALGTILSNLVGEMSREPTGRSLTAGIREQAAAVGCELDGVWLETDGGKRTVTVTKAPCAGGRECLNTLLPLVAALTGEKLTLAAQCGDATRGTACRLAFQTAGRFRVQTGWASAAKDGVSGDSCAVLALPAERVALVLSDGMGSGRRAAGESAATVRFLERLLTAGFSVAVAVKTVNSLLLLRLPEESFTTVDMAIVDTSAGEAEFLKVGAAPSFVKRVGEVATMQSASLPVGIMPQVEIDPVKWLLAPGDIIVMVSDGVVDIPGRRMEREPWLVNFLRRLPDGDPQEMATAILRQARELTGPHLRDDMTVLVARVTAKPGLEE
jgi:stage II sporulation protein E